MEALDTVITSVPSWHVMLDDLQTNMAIRQAEFAKLPDYRPYTPSLKNKGSTESLKPSDDLPSKPADASIAAAISNESATSPLLPDITSQLPNAFIPLRVSMPNAPPLLHANSSPVHLPQFRLNPQRGLPGPLSQTSVPAAPLLVTQPAVLRKRKTPSIASGNSQAQKLQSRTMVLVYYDKAVQDAFEELVKHVSASRNAMRKAKMAARMADMRRQAELEIGDEDDDDDDPPDTLPVLQTRMMRPSARLGAGLGTDADSPHMAERSVMKVDDDPSSHVPTLRYVSTRRMGPSRDMPDSAKDSAPSQGFTPTFPSSKDAPAMLRAATPARGMRNMSMPPARPSTRIGGQSTIYDELDTGLEWCQSMCEHAAHQFLRDGQCDVEIDGIKKRLSEVRETAEREVKSVQSRAEEMPQDSKTVLAATLSAELPESRVSTINPAAVGREFKPIQMRKAMPPEKRVEVPNSMEIDDEGIEDMNIKPLLASRVDDDYDDYDDCDDQDDNHDGNYDDTYDDDQDAASTTAEEINLDALRIWSHSREPPRM